MFAYIKIGTPPIYVPGSLLLNMTFLRMPTTHYKGNIDCPNAIFW